MTVGAFPAVPAGERSFVGMDPIFDEPVLLPAEVVPVEAAAVVGVVEVVGAVVVGVAEELLHPASPRADADSATSDQVRIRDMEHDPFERQVKPR